MFGRANVFATLSRFAGIRVKDEREKDRNHIVEVQWEAPITFDMLDEISPALARDLFDDVRGELVPKAEISEIAPMLALGRQVMTVRPHPDQEPLGRLAGVEIRKIWIFKSGAGTWLMSWLTCFPFEERTVIGLIQHLKLGVYLTFEPEAGALPFDGKAAAAGDDSGDDDNVTDFAEARRRSVGSMPTDQAAETPAKKRGGRRKARNPDQVKADQIDDARSRQNDDDGGDEADAG